MDLTFINGTLEGKSLNFNDSLLTIGRSYTNILMLNDDDVSSRHAFIELLDKRWVLFDNGSLNGVLLNNNKIEDNSELFDGDIVRIGKVRFTVSLGEKKKRPKESVRGRLNSTISQTLGIKHLSKRKSKLLKGKAQNGAKELRQERLERLRKKKATLKTRHRYTIATMLIFTAICFNLFYPDFVEASLERQHHFSNSAFKAAPRQLIVQQAKQAPLPVKRVIPATIFISSFPNDAFVELDGKNIGTTPVNLQEIPPGIHTLTISKEGFIPQQRTVKLPGKIMHNFNLMLEDYSALIRSTPPGAAVLIGGQLRGHTPLLLKDLSSGATSITLQAPGFRKLEHQISISETKLHTKVHLHLESNLGAMRIVTLPPGCQIFFNKQKMRSTTSKNDNAVSEEILLEKLIPGEYDITVTSADGSESKNIRVTVKGGETTQSHIQLWSITTVLTLDDDSKVYGMLLGKNENGDILFSAEKGKSSAYKIDQVTAIDKSSLQDKFGFNTGIELRTDRFKPILATIHDEADERDFTELEEEAEDAGTFTSSQINTDSNALDLIEFQSKYKNKKISITGTVSMIREGESKFSIVIDDNIECYLEKTDDLQKQQLVKRLNKQITISGFCLGLRGLDKVVIENSRVNK